MKKTFRQQLLLEMTNLTDSSLYHQLPHTYITRITSS